MKNTKPLFFYWGLYLLCIVFVPLNEFIMKRVNHYAGQTFTITLRILYENISGVVFGILIFLLILLFQKIAHPTALKVSVISVACAGIALIFTLYAQLISFNMCLLFGIALCQLGSTIFQISKASRERG